MLLREHRDKLKEIAHIIWHIDHGLEKAQSAANILRFSMRSGLLSVEMHFKLSHLALNDPPRVTQSIVSLSSQSYLMDHHKIHKAGQSEVQFNK
jgi:hypothetical protein